MPGRGVRRERRAGRAVRRVAPVAVRRSVLRLRARVRCRERRRGRRDRPVLERRLREGPRRTSGVPRPGPGGEAAWMVFAEFARRGLSEVRLKVDAGNPTGAGRSTCGSGWTSCAGTPSTSAAEPRSTGAAGVAAGRRARRPGGLRRWRRPASTRRLPPRRPCPSSRS